MTTLQLNWVQFLLGEGIGQYKPFVRVDRKELLLIIIISHGLDILGDGDLMIGHLLVVSEIQLLNSTVGSTDYHCLTLIFVINVLDVADIVRELFDFLLAPWRN